ncbi:hypothetical protein L5515_000340 [Caenorhabditis briggsae]|uniref:NTF2-like domain-containing protein n=1 Tax=Caenorhabditis briggsae TaxID=6238 RepID=A0AAE9DY31_CAEBR|nr:hypothetical protein L5515_000340 [Caenorhabditis briggsae]
MWKRSSILLLLLVGASWAFVPDDPEFTFFESDGPVEVAKRFLDRIKRSVESRDVAVISGLFNPGFEFNGCKGDYNKEKVVGILSHLPTGTPFSMNLQFSVTLGADQIKYSVSVSGFGPSPIIAEFILNIHDQQLQSGSIPACQHLMGFFRNVVANTPEEQVKAFLDRLKAAITSRDSTALLNLFQPDFKFIGCKATYDRDQSVEMFMQIPVEAHLDYKFKSVLDLGDSIKTVVIAEGLKATIHVEFEFVLNKKDQKIEKASMVCPKPFSNDIRAFMGQEGSPMEVAQKFLDRVKRSVDSRDVAVPCRIRFIGCKATYDRDQSVEMFMQIPAEAYLAYTFKSVQDLGDSIKTVVIAEGFKATIHVEFEFVLSKKDQKIEKASMVCPKRRWLVTAKYGNKGQFDNFLDELTKDIETGNAILIGTHFDEGFEYEGMRGTYNKRQLVGILSRLPHNHQFSFKLHKIGSLQKDNKVDIGVTVTGLGPAPFETSFVLDTRIFSLKSGKYLKNEIGSVPRRKPLGTAEEMVHDFLDRVTKATALKNYEEISGLFEDSFVFKGCRGKYTKEQVIKILGKLPAGTKFTINLMEVNDQESTVKYTVQIVGMGAMDMQAEFVLNKKTQKLVSGGIPLCQDSQLDSNSIVEQFLAIMQPAVDARDGTKLASLFDDEFKFNTCNGYEDKAAAIAKIMSAPSMFKISINFVSSRFLANGQIETVVDIISIMGRERTMFLLDLTKNVLVAGQLYKCP